MAVAAGRMSTWLQKILFFATGHVARTRPAPWFFPLQVSSFPQPTMSAIFAATRASLRNTRAPTMMLRRSLHIENTPETVRIHSFFGLCI